MKWHYTKDGDKPKALDKSVRSIPCVVKPKRKYGYDLFYWEVDYDYWDDRVEDDCAIELDEVEKWGYVEDEIYEKE